jgi:hypothetical protein
MGAERVNKQEIELLRWYTTRFGIFNSQNGR